MEPSGLTTKYTDDLPKVNDNEAAIIPHGIVYHGGKKRFIRNDFMGSSYNDIADKVKKDMT